jgi:hypothetical protein
MPTDYEGHVKESERLIFEATDLLDHPQAAGYEQAQAKATLAVAEALLAAGEQLRSLTIRVG